MKRVVELLRRAAVIERWLPANTALSLRTRVQRLVGALEPEFAILPRLVPVGRNAVDAGANVGVYSYALSGLARTVYAFEPNGSLSRVLGRARLANVEIAALALSDHCGTAELTVPVVDRALRPARGFIGTAQDAASQTVRLVTLDSRELEDIGFCKIDVEGHELCLLRGAAQTISRDRPNMMIEIEAGRVHKGTLEDVFELLHSWGYRGWFYDRGSLRELLEFDVGLHQTARRSDNSFVNNFLFVPRERGLELPRQL